MKNFSEEQRLDQAERLDEVRRKIVEALADPRPALTAEALGKRLRILHRKTVKARRQGT
ncbi:hypothetical protein RA307_27865 [Xanthobacteraceae bacterium Astr-EGSB]|uniref:hypothetical protein n=1 Tax=Astrobacterium formosum TaxID=3069710 RepID=UPI0027ADE2B2|nr:hypothetical protein [Xanthobacteraceae bacterium Astr-EGSB]